MSEKRFLGYGRAHQYERQLRPGEMCLEEGRRVYATPPDFFCPHCDGAGCRSCKWTGERRHPKPKESA